MPEEWYGYSMKKFIKRDKINKSIQTEKFEPILDAIFVPVTPRPEFVGELRKRLAGQVQPVKTGPSVWQYAVWISAGLVSGVVLIVGGVRAATSILVALGVIQQVKKAQQAPESSLKPVL
jgi:hypothetical protein